MKDSPLKVEIIDGLLSITIGVDTLAFAINNDGKTYEGFNVTNAVKFAEDVLHELEREEEDGTTVVHEMLDEAAFAAACNGSEWTEDRLDNE